MKFLVSTFFTRIRNPLECNDVCNIIPTIEPGSIETARQTFHYGRYKTNTCVVCDYCIVKNARVKNYMNNYADELIQRHQPKLVLYQAGADAWDQDPYEAGYLSKCHMGFRDSGIFRSAKKHLIPIAWNLAGGYSEPMQKTIDLHLQTLKISDQTFEGVK